MRLLARLGRATSEPGRCLDTIHLPFHHLPTTLTALWCARLPLPFTPGMATSVSYVIEKEWPRLAAVLLAVTACYWYACAHLVHVCAGASTARTLAPRPLQACRAGIRNSMGSAHCLRRVLE